MGQEKNPEKVKLFMAVMLSSGRELEPVVENLCRMFGPVAFRYGPVDFDFTDYYEKEMGSKLLKAYFTFENLIERDAIASIKQATNRMELEYREGSARRVNIDPGYLSRDKLVLASTKDFYHRIYLSGGIYAEVTLHYRREKFRHFSWTYPDYMAPGLLDFLARVRL